MPKLIIDGQAAYAAQPELDYFHGNSIFTTLRSKDDKPLMWHSHYQRLYASAAFFGFAMPKEPEIYRLIEEQLGKQDQKIRIIIAKKRFAITLEDYLPPSPEVFDGVSVITSSMQVHPQLAQHKTGNSLPYSMAAEEAKEKNAFEALLCNQHGRVVDGSRTSIMMFDGHTLVSVEGGLKGCMREQALQYAKECGIDVKRGHFIKSELSGQMLLANSLIGVVPVDKVKFDFVDKLIDHFRMDRY